MAIEMKSNMLFRVRDFAGRCIAVPLTSIESHVDRKKVPVRTLHPHLALNTGQTVLPTLSESPMIREIEMTRLPIVVWTKLHCRLSISQEN